MLAFVGLKATPAFARALTRTRFRAGRADAFRRSLGQATVAALDASISDISIGHLRAWGS